MTSNLEYCRKQRTLELPKFVKVLKAMPQDRLDYRPDPKARTAAELAWTLAEEEAALASLLETGQCEWKQTPPPASVDEIVAAYERHASAVNAKLSSIDEAGWAKKGQFLMGGQVAWEDSIAEFVWGFLFDAIHHRGQLSTYLRPMGGKVPAIYGPSADDTGQ
ncbi:MAG: DinB family protein [Vicinamibacteria bacterium]